MNPFKIEEIKKNEIEVSLKLIVAETQCKIWTTLNEKLLFLILRIYKLLLFINTFIVGKFQTGVTEM